MNELTTRKIAFAESDLTRASAAVEARFDDPVEEARRVEVTRRFLTAAMTVEQALRIHTRCALVNHCGTHGNSNLADAASGLFEALSGYHALMREIARNYGETADQRVGGHVTLEVA